MFDTIATILQQLIEFTKTRRLGQRQLFSDHIEPIFQQMIVIHEDYMNGIKEIMVMLKDSLDPETIRDLIIEKKYKQEHLRQLVYDLNKTCILSPYSKNAIGSFDRDPRNVKEATFKFANAIQCYFELTIGISPRNGSTYYVGLSDVVDQLLEDKIDYDKCFRLAGSAMNRLPLQWSLVTSSYAKLRYFCYKPK